MAIRLALRIKSFAIIETMAHLTLNQDVPEYIRADKDYKDDV
jgi:hypothetical protein